MATRPSERANLLLTCRSKRPARRVLQKYHAESFLFRTKNITNQLDTMWHDYTVMQMGVTSSPEMWTLNQVKLTDQLNKYNAEDRAEILLNNDFLYQYLEKFKLDEVGPTSYPSSSPICTRREVRKYNELAEGRPSIDSASSQDNEIAKNDMGHKISQEPPLINRLQDTEQAKLDYDPAEPPEDTDAPLEAIPEETEGDSGATLSNDAGEAIAPADRAAPNEPPDTIMRDEPTEEETLSVGLRLDDLVIKDNPERDVAADPPGHGNDNGYHSLIANK